MAFEFDLDSDEYGSLEGDDSIFPISCADHDWSTPYPPVGTVIQFSWEPGENGRMPDVFWYPQMRDFVCNERAYMTLKRCAGSDIHTVAQGVLDGEPMFVVQAPKILHNVVDKDKSIIDFYPGYEILQFPVFRRESAGVIASRVFRVPGSVTMVFVGDDVKQACEDTKIEGVRFIRADWAES